MSSHYNSLINLKFATFNGSIKFDDAFEAQSKLSINLKNELSELYEVDINIEVKKIHRKDNLIGFEINPVCDHQITNDSCSMFTAIPTNFSKYLLGKNQIVEKASENKFNDFTMPGYNMDELSKLNVMKSNIDSLLGVLGSEESDDSDDDRPLSEADIEKMNKLFAEGLNLFHPSNQNNKDGCSQQ